MQLQCFSNDQKSNLNDLDYSHENNGRRFETVSKGVFSTGIQIRNLKKTYETNFFNKSVNIYNYKLHTDKRKINI